MEVFAVAVNNSRSANKTQAQSWADGDITRVVTDSRKGRPACMRCTVAESTRGTAPVMGSATFFTPPRACVVHMLMEHAM